MVMSMTGYGIETFHQGDLSLTIEIRTVNSRYLDLKANLPRSLNSLELEIKKLIQANIERGRVELSVHTSGRSLEAKSLFVDWDLMDQYFEQIEAIKSRYQLKGEIPLSLITSMDQLIAIQEEEQEDDQLHEFILNGIQQVIDKVIETRKSEGKHLLNDIEKRMQVVEAELKQIDNRKEKVYAEYSGRIKERIEAHFEANQGFDEHYLMQEVALLAEKSDITEEIIRLDSHLAHMKQVIQQNSAIGRKLDFIIQEIHREVNTIGSKSVDTRISESVVLIKSNLEKIKEQVQNIE